MELETGFEKVIGMDGEITGIRKHGLIYIVIEDFKEYQTHCTQDKILKVFTSKSVASLDDFTAEEFAEFCRSTFE